MSQSPAHESPNDDLNEILKKLQIDDSAERNRGMAILVQQYGPRLLGFAKGLLAGSQEDAEDLLQECLLQIANIAKELDFLTFSYLCGRISGLCSNFRRAKKRKRIADVEITTARPEEGSQTRTHDPVDKNASTRFARRIESEAVRSALDRISRKHQELLRLKYHEDLTHEELASQYSVSMRTIQNRLEDARSALTRRLIDGGWDPPSCDAPAK